MSNIYPQDWSKLKIKFFEQIKHKKETPQELNPSTKYYLKKFDQYQAKPFLFSWNWPSFLIFGIWHFYRKNYLPLIAAVILTVISQSLIKFFNLNINSWILSFINLGPSIALTIVSNKFYIDKVLKRIENNKAPLTPNFWSGFCSIIFILILSIFLEYYEKIIN